MTGTRVFESLDAEWALVCAGAGRAEMVLGWLREGGVLAAARGLAELLAELECWDRARGRVHSDRWMRVLLERAGGEVAGAQLAARVVVQAMLPGAVRMTQRLRAGRNFDATGHVVVACLYQVVRRYPLWRRGGVAATLLLETLHMASRELRAESETDAVPWHPVLETVPGEPAAADDPTEAVWRTVLRRQAAEAGLLRAGEVPDGARGELVELLVWAVAAGLLDVVRARVIADESRAGARESAEAAGVSAVTWRQRRSRTVRQLRPIADRWTQAA
ncbi:MULTISPECIES: hypothetical protein [unclassified Streptomyces]|uniref:hypothetical protein n=1 Tax=unclassified Streptomyces TaxID=2593676 RepID=UPI0022563E04|nr:MULTISPECIES: hypothetical protein [unclassified Streptomyces]MCX4871070.1 hypothetical protein [Streptomyces sp. NBC_00906]MCX4902702.1 hypothetical protein [Streptomyces sp. NBC_00892]